MVSQIQIQPPTFEHHHSGFGVGTSKPRISWRFSCQDAATNGWKQSAYEIEILRKGDDESKKNNHTVETSQSTLVPWPCEPLRSREWAKVRVRAFGKAGDAGGNQDAEPTDWSSWETVECALLERNDWTAQPITASFTTPLETEKPLRPLLFRRSFHLPNGRGKVTSARLYITAFGVYESYINGSAVSDHCMAPGWTSYRHHLNYETLDVTSLLREDALNVIGVEAAPGWYMGRLGFWGGRLCIYGKDISVLAQLEVEFGQGEKYTLLSDDSWKCQFSPLIQSEIYDGEIYDMREEQDGWATGSTDFDEASWTHAKVIGYPEAKLVAPDAPPVRITEEVSPVEIFKSASGKTIIDFGQNLVGKLRINEITRPAGHKITLIHAEVMDKGELGLTPLRGAKCTDEIVSSGKTLRNWSPKFTFHGFRYVQVDGWDTTDESQPLTKESVIALVAHTDMRRTGWFECSHPLVNKLHQNALWSMRGNFLSIPTDCPQRDERFGWTGDLQVFCASANFLYDTTGMLGGWLQDLASEQSEQEGIPPLVVPNVLEKVWEPVPQAVWDDVTILAPWEIYLSTGDVEVLRKQYPSMKEWLDKGVRRGDDGLWDSELWQLGDWLDPKAPAEEPGDARTDSTLVADAYLVHVTSVFAQVSSLLQDGEHSERLRDAEKLKKIFRHKYIAPSGLLIGDTQTALALAIVFDLHETKEQVVTAGARLARLVRIARFRVATGFAGTPIITHALSKTGHHQLAYRMLLEKRCPSWMYPITMGATTIWERWDSMLPDGSINTGEMTSFNHYALGSIVDWLHKVVGGIKPKDAGWQTVLVQPRPGGTIRNAKVSYESPYGRIECEWSINKNTENNNEEFDLRLVIPPNSEALVTLPNKQCQAKEAVLVGSGTHTFSCKYLAESWPPNAISSYMGEPDNGEIV